MLTVTSIVVFKDLWLEDNDFSGVEDNNTGLQRRILTSITC